MKFLASRQSLPWWLLIISIAFNLGFGTTYGVKTYGQSSPTTADIATSGGGGGTMSMVTLHENLDLTPEQEVQVQQINEDLINEISAFRAEMRETRIVLSQLLGATEVDQDAIADQLAAVSAIQRDAQGLVIDHLLQEKQLLRPDQLEAFNEVIQSRVCRGYGPGSGPGSGRGQGDGSGRGRGTGRGQGRGR